MFYVTKKNDGIKKLFDDFFDFPVLRKEMRTDVKDENDNYVFEIEIPGFTKEDIKLSVEDDYLTVEAVKEEAKENTENNNYIIRERQYGAVKRSYYIGNVKEDSIKANYNDGVLTILIPKAVETEKKFITIE